MIFKKYVKVIALCDENGKLTPGYIVWLNGQKYRIDKIHEIRNASSQAGGCGVLYVCSINGKIRKLFYEVDKWFIESTRP
ncbi:hypothetical protein M2475_002146 [Breznakia sp. PF5-3]|uniref:hypothetical protein n=1 Tax=unclassified Breznakia TaxID=2623764 RepID=UPI0024062884|nr:MULTISPECIES: hypothetical protein [unclassified Breznakia]MDF9825744.1 hypothetical protein [Breznakia sp. PM6-1]MDF9836565.1 hypothetical protein [Breznakia sp. PF5-3]MDF9838783.1 hypothetical protein [Breznakia sp. PFB2-8]MDF9860803.1 hypothetical protein [Breznakia sp. PH5-24]